MKQLIKSATLYNAVLPSSAELAMLLSEAPFVDLLSLQTRSVGFVSREEPVQNSEGLAEPAGFVETFAGGMAFTFRLDQKIIPGSVVKAETLKRVKTIEAETGRKVGKKEKAELRFMVVDELAVRALVLTTLITCYHHTESNFLIVPTTNKKLAEAAVHELVLAVGSVKTTTIHVNGVSSGLTAKLKAWLADGEFDVDVSPTNEVVLEQEKRKVTVKMEDLEQATTGIQEALSSGFQVKSLGLAFPKGTVAKLTSDFKLKGIEMFAASDTGEAAEEEPTFSAQASLEVDEVVGMAQVLCEMFDYKAEEPVA